MPFFFGFHWNKKMNLFYNFWVINGIINNSFLYVSSTGILIIAEQLTIYACNCDAVVNSKNIFCSRQLHIYVSICNIHIFHDQEILCNIFTRFPKTQSGNRSQDGKITISHGGSIRGYCCLDRQPLNSMSPRYAIVLGADLLYMTVGSLLSAHLSWLLRCPLSERLQAAWCRPLVGQEYCPIVGAEQSIIETPTLHCFLPCTCTRCFGLIGLHLKCIESKEWPQSCFIPVNQFLESRQ